MQEQCAMTAEIAILNKSAVALATDSAVTISSDNSHKKVFDSADKLFEMSVLQPIGIMIYNGMQFCGMPLPDLIKEFRARGETFDSISASATSFLQFLSDEGGRVPTNDKSESFSGLAKSILDSVDKRLEDAFTTAVREPMPEGVDLSNYLDKVIQSEIAVIERFTRMQGRGNFLGIQGLPKLSRTETSIVKTLVEETFPQLAPQIRKRIGNIAKSLIFSNRLSSGKTGIVVAGFGKDERFPSLISFEIDGVIGGRLKYVESSKCEIGKGNERAYVRPFAQKEMVERFLYGLDDEIQNIVLQFCKDTIGEISKGIFDRLTFVSESDMANLKTGTERAEESFLRNLKENAFKVIQSRSRLEIEDMIQFMPKPELAKMAEALIDLTSLKRKVTVGVETVGGPVDVAVISKAEGFVWVKRKHYFPPELNGRYFERMREFRSTVEGAVKNGRKPTGKKAT